MLRSAASLGMEFEYPWNNDKKKMKFVIKGLQLARYLVTVLGSNIKTVTWMGDNINYNTVFQGGSASYLDEDVNELDGDYDVTNSAVTIIDKLGPLDSDAPYVVEFKKEPQANDWGNFMISCQGIGDDVQISSLEGSATAAGSTTVDSMDCNAYSTINSMEPGLNSSTFTPVSPATETIVSASYAGDHTTNVDSDTAAIRTMYSGADTNYARLAVYANKLPAGYYLVTLGIGAYSTAAITTSPVFTGIASAVSEHKSLTQRVSTINWGSFTLKYFAQAFAIHLNADASTDQGLLVVDFTSGANINLTGWSAMISPITASYYNSI